VELPLQSSKLVFVIDAPLTKTVNEGTDKVYGTTRQISAESDETLGQISSSSNNENSLGG